MTGTHPSAALPDPSRNPASGAPQTLQRCLIGVDVGTGSARAGVFDVTGNLLAAAKSDITLYRGPGAMVEQSSAEIWDAVCRSVRSAVAQSGISPGSVAGIGFDATCSLVVLGKGGVPLAVGLSDDPARNIIVWMDHRAVDQAARITATGHPVLRYVGGTISPEMQTPKLLWLHEHRPEVFDAAWQFFDLADFLTWRATGSLARSSCTLTCKWTYLAHETRWDQSYFAAIGLGVLSREGFARIGTDVVSPGTALAAGLTAAAAGDLGLVPGTPVGAGMIDAHAGGIGTVGADGDPAACLGYVFGTSSCTMTTTAAPAFVPGVWGPYYDAMVPGVWLVEGGQSAAGAAIDHLLTLHPAAPEAASLAAAAGQPLPVWLSHRCRARLSATGGLLSDAVTLAGGLHVVPEFLGNRAPFADPHARAIVAGLGLDMDIDSLMAIYVAGLCGIGYGLRQIIAAQTAHGAGVARIVISGGAGQDDLIRQLLADAAGLPVVATMSDEPVLLGAAILGAVAGAVQPGMMAAMGAMSRTRTTCTPAPGAVRTLHEHRFAAFEKLQDVARAIRPQPGFAQT